VNCLVRRSRVTQIWAGFVGVAALLLAMGCHKPRETRSVHLPLAVGNRWVYNVETDSGQGTAVVEVVSQDDGAYGLTVNCDTGHLAQSDSLLRLTCRDTVLSLLRSYNRRTWWSSILSDDPSDSCTQTLLLYRKQSGSTYASQLIGTVVVGGDTFADCLRLSCRCAHDYFALLFGGGDTMWVSEDYAPGVGIVRLEVEQHWWSWGWIIFEYSDSGKWVDRWELRDYSLVDQ
jgi:hypothetical protein